MIRYAIFAFAIFISAARLALAADPAVDVAPFIQQHCVDCHGPDVQKAKLRLDTLAPKFDDSETAATWTKVLDKLTAGEMPPPKKERPRADELAATTAWLHQQLHDASLAKQRQVGRVPLRRLNKVEYENTLRDLLGAPIEVSDLLPDDQIGSGFDDVASALNLSSAHFVKYQEAAERALETAMPTRPVKHFKEHRTGKDLAKNAPGFSGYVGRWLQLKDDSLLMFARPPFWTSIAYFPRDLQPGIYRVRLSASAVNTNGKPLPLAFARVSEIHITDGEPQACFDVQADKPTDITYEFQVRPQERLLVFGWTQPTENDLNYHNKGDWSKTPTLPGIAVHSVDIEGPLDAPPGEGYRRMFGDMPLKATSVVAAMQNHQPLPKIDDNRRDDDWKRDPLIPYSEDPKADSQKLLRNFLPLAFRRPVDEETIQHFHRFALARIDKGYGFGEAMLATYRLALCSINFLFMEQKPGALDGYALASRLSYFVWRSMPDAELLDLAKSGEILKHEVLHAQLERLLKDPKAQRFIDDFTGQWLDLRKINATTPDQYLYPEYNPYLLWSMPLETKAFFTEVLYKNLPITQFIDSDWTFVNDRLAQHYGLPNVEGGQMRRVSLPPEAHRGGILTQAAILKVTADGTRTSPVLRGKWVLDKITGQPPSPPPPDIPAIDPDIRGATTIRQQLEKHRGSASCASCHKVIDPPGFALETYDVVGGWREFYRTTKASPVSNWAKAKLANYPSIEVFVGPNVEKGDKTPDGRAFHDIEDYKKILLVDKDQLIRNMVQKVMVYSTGGEIQFADREIVEQIVAKVRHEDGPLRTILHEIVDSRVFTHQ